MCVNHKRSVENCLAAKTINGFGIDKKPVFNIAQSVCNAIMFIIVPISIPSPP